MEHETGVAGRLSLDITAGQLGERFGLLPSEVWARATDYDLRVAALLSQIDRHVAEKSKG